ncbi:MAG: PHB depolymerase family esterase [Hydrogenophaga sp.]|nr:PHB depolymerase family esterase [Hydrogenophaga sp.]
MNILAIKKRFPGLMALVLGSGIGALPAALYAAAALPQLRIDRSEVTVSGLSSGAFMAVQLHVAYSGTFTKGVGAIAGGPFYCAENSTVHALARCMKWPAGIPTQKLVATTQAWADQDRIDSTQHLARSRVYLFSGTEDGTVKPGVVGELARYYAHWVPAAQRVYQQNIAAGHGIVTDGAGNACPSSASPFINNCGFDLVGQMFSHLYGPLQPKAQAEKAAGLREFDQTPFAAQGMAGTGWIYVPESCAAGGSACRLHIALHGCRQNSDYVKDRFVQKAGYNRWAEANRMVVLYPQTGGDAPNGCWDWWGYSGHAYATRSGPQMKAVKGMVDRLLGK